MIFVRFVLLLLLVSFNLNLELFLKIIIKYIKYSICYLGFK